VIDILNNTSLQAYTNKKKKYVEKYQ